MLQSIRDHLTGWIAVLIFAPLILAFALWGIQNYHLGTRNFAAKVNGEEISLDEVRAAVRNRLAMFARFAPNGLSPEQETQIRADVVGAFVQREVISQRARKLGYRVSDAELIKSIHDIPQFQSDGKFDRDTYERMLSLQGYSPDSFEASMRRDLGVQQLENGVVRSSFVTPDELRRRTELEDEQREVAYAVFPSKAQESDIQIADADVQARYEARKAEFVTPETLSLQYVELSAEALAAESKVDESEVRQQYDKDLADGRYKKPEERQARHILLTLDGKDDAAVEAQAKKLVERARGGEDFAALAREYSQDKSTAKDGGELGWVTPDMMVAPFSDALFAMDKGQISDPVRTDFGWHVIDLEDVRGGEVQPYAEVHDQILQELKQRKADTLFYDRADQLGQRAFESRDSLEPVARELGLQLQRVDGVTRDHGEGIAAEGAVRNAAFSDNVVESGDNSDVIQIGDDKAVVLRVVDRKPAAQRPLEEVRGEIETQLREEAAKAKAEAVATDVLAKLRDGGSLETLASENGGEYHAAGFVTRQAAPPELITAVFAAPKPKEGAPPYDDQVALANGDHVVYALTAVKAGMVAPGAEAAQQQARAQKLAGERGNAELSAYVGELQSKASVVISKDQLDTLGE